MFGLPNAKRVKRTELFSSISSSEDETDRTSLHQNDKMRIEDPKSKSDQDEGESSRPADQHNDTTEQATKIDYGFDYIFIDKTQETKSNPTKPIDTTTKTNPSTSNPEEPEEQTYAFNLFAPKPTTTNTSTNQTTTTTTKTKITIHSPTPEPTSSESQGRIIHPRPLTHYFTDAHPHQHQQTKRDEYIASATSGTTIQTHSTSPWPGTFLSWRVIELARDKVTVRKSKGETAPAGRGGKRTRPSKKRRIERRQRIAARKAMTIKSEEEEREKRTRRNREKKVKRKLREKAKKVGEAGVGDVQDVVGEGDDGEVGAEDE